MKNPRSFLLLALLFIISPLILASSTAAQDEMIIQYASRNDVSGIARVIREGGNIDFRDEKSGQTALMRAILSGQTSAVYYLLKHGARTDYEPIFRACWGSESRHTETVRIFLEAGVPVGVLGGPGGKMTLEEAARSNKMTTQLIERYKKREKDTEKRGGKEEGGNTRSETEL
ncbi:hypothetical protein TrRE_jg12975 [Triparma retinervis]|uniref:Ankyrin repeat domain-containing protein n=1 Tax=Triparma retinervis TaxID=2557542 RepID=A0A9W7E8F6_9STRA|nr:hypothetical protein TrRE_jg12975 [Triparma retinervis]